MVESKKSKRVSWASDVDLCQVRLFLSEDSPSQVGLGAQDHLQAKASWLLHSCGASDDQLPPGFEGALSAKQPKIDLSRIPLVKWQRPQRLVLNPHWQVVAGEESKEVEVQNQREMRILEAVYPRPSNIPPSPHSPPPSPRELEDDRHIPVIPVTPIEDEDVNEASTSSMSPSDIPTTSELLALPPQSILPPVIPQTSQSQPNQNPALAILPGVLPDVVAAATAAFTAMMRSSEQGSLVDKELLIKILNNPNLMGNLVAGYAASASQPTDLSVPQSSPPPVHMNTVMTVNHSATRASHQTVPNPRSPPINSVSQSCPPPVQMNTLVTTNHAAALANQQAVPKPRSPPLNSSIQQSSPHPAHMSTVTTSNLISAAAPIGHFHPVTNAASSTSHTQPPPGFAPVSAPTVRPPGFSHDSTSPATPPGFSQAFPPNVRPGFSQNSAPPVNPPGYSQFSAPTVRPHGFSADSTLPANPTGFSQVSAPTVRPPGFSHNSAPATQPPGFPQVSAQTAPTGQTPPMKDINYYKNLIQLHGEAQQAHYHHHHHLHHQTQPPPQFAGNHNNNYNPSGQRSEALPRDNKLKVNKPCVYFNSSRGCRHGANCVYQHDASIQTRVGSSMPEAPNAKRMKVEREISGRS